MAKRPRFQFHLSTTIVLMLVASVLLWANAAPTRDPFPIQLGISFQGAGPLDAYGWPTIHCRQRPWDIFALRRAVRNGDLNEWEWHYRNLALNILIAVMCLILTALVCESLLRRRSRR